MGPIALAIIWNGSLALTDVSWGIWFLYEFLADIEISKYSNVSSPEHTFGQLPSDAASFHIGANPTFTANTFFNA